MSPLSSTATLPNSHPVHLLEARQSVGAGVEPGDRTEAQLAARPSRGRTASRGGTSSRCASSRRSRCRWRTASPRARACRAWRSPCGPCAPRRARAPPSHHHWSRASPEPRPPPPSPTAAFGMPSCEHRHERGAGVLRVEVDLAGFERGVRDRRGAEVEASLDRVPLCLERLRVELGEHDALGEVLAADRRPAAAGRPRRRPVRRCRRSCRSPSSRHRPSCR